MMSLNPTSQGRQAKGKKKIMGFSFVIVWIEYQID